MTFNHGVRSSTLRWSTNKTSPYHPVGGCFVSIFPESSSSNPQGFDSASGKQGKRFRQTFHSREFRLSDGAPTKEDLCIGSAILAEKTRTPPKNFLWWCFCRWELTKGSLREGGLCARRSSADGGFGLPPDFAQWTSTRYACPRRERRESTRKQVILDY